MYLSKSGHVNLFINVDFFVKARVFMSEIASCLYRSTKLIHNHFRWNRVLHKLKLKSKTPFLTSSGFYFIKRTVLFLTFNNYRGTSIVALIGQRHMHICNAQLFRQF